MFMRKRYITAALLCCSLILGSCDTKPRKDADVLSEYIETTSTVSTSTAPEAQTSTETSIETEEATNIMPETNTVPNDNNIRKEIEGAVKEAMEANTAMRKAYKESDTLTDEEVAKKVYEAFDLKTYYYFSTGKISDWKTIVKHFENSGALKKSAVTQSSEDDGTTDPADTKWELTDCGSITDEKYIDMHNMLYGIDEELSFLSGTIPSFDTVSRVVGIEDVWCCNVDVCTKATEEGIRLFEETDPEIIAEYTATRGIYLSDDGYFVSPMSMFVFYRDGKWRVCMGYTSLYRMTNLYKRGVIDSIAGLSGR